VGKCSGLQRDVGILVMSMRSGPHQCTLETWLVAKLIARVLEAAIENLCVKTQNVVDF
jgi:hypothetical protein